MHRLATILFVLSLGCSKKYQSYVPRYQFTNKSAAPNYANLDYWAAHPWKKDPSDSLPVALQSKKNDSLVDVFFIHPTTYTGERNLWYADINNPLLNAKTDYSSIVYQASVFNHHCRVFAPRYRQAHFSAFFITNSEETKAAFDTAYADVSGAFEAFLENFNHGRPIIIAGHSQGALMAERLLKEYFDGKPLQQQLVAAYIVGWPIPQNSFQQIPVCTDSLQTGCFCGWRTLRLGYVPKYIQKEEVPSFVTNPLSWDTTGTHIPRSENKGSVLKDFSKIVPATTDAQIHGNVLWVNKPKFPGSALYKAKNYHIGDMNLFYMNIRQNIEQRIFAYLTTHSLNN
jgi:pimeloyl-ACP methyl ester carboxylesterase